MRILLTNDDGVNARGLRLLESGRAQAQPTTSGSSLRPKSNPAPAIR